MWKEFKEFAFKGNVMDMAIGVVIGGAFSAIVTSIVNDIIMPITALLTGGMDFSTAKYVITEAVIEDGVEVVPEVAIAYGNFIQNIIDFLIIAFCIFMIVKAINKMRAMGETTEEVEEEPAGPTSEELLTEIRDLLKDK